MVLPCQAGTNWKPHESFTRLQRRNYSSDRDNALLGRHAGVSYLSHVTKVLACSLSSSGKKETFGVPFLSGIVLAALIIFEFGAIFTVRNATSDYFAHLGGYFMGILSAAALTWKAENQPARLPAYVSKLSHGKSPEHEITGQQPLSPIKQTTMERKS